MNHHFPKLERKIDALKQELETTLNETSSVEQALANDIDDKLRQIEQNKKLQSMFTQKHAESKSLHFEVKQLMNCVEHFDSNARAGKSMVSETNYLLSQKMQELFNAQKAKTDLMIQLIQQDRMIDQLQFKKQKLAIRINKRKAQIEKVHQNSLHTFDVSFPRLSSIALKVRMLIKKISFQTS